MNKLKTTAEFILKEEYKSIVEGKEIFDLEIDKKTLKKLKIDHEKERKRRVKYFKKIFPFLKKRKIHEIYISSIETDEENNANYDFIYE